MVSCCSRTCGCLVFGVGQLVLHMENGLIEIFLSLCGPSAPAPSCWDERRWQTSCAAVAVLLAEWRERGSCITACLHLNPSMALTTALANSFRLREAAAVVASGGDAGDDDDTEQQHPSSKTPRERRVAIRCK